MKKIVFIIAAVILLSCNNESTTTIEQDTTRTKGSPTNVTPTQDDTTSYERMSNRLDSSHQH